MLETVSNSKKNSTGKAMVRQQFQTFSKHYLVQQQKTKQNNKNKEINEKKRKPNRSVASKG